MAKENPREQAQLKLFKLTPNPVERAKEWDASIIIDGVEYYGEVKSMKSDLTAISVTDRLSYAGIDSWDLHRDFWFFSKYDPNKLPLRSSEHLLVFRSEMQVQYELCRQQIARPGRTRMGGEELEEFRKEVEELFPADRYSNNPERKERIDYMLERASWSKAAFNWSLMSQLGRNVKTPKNFVEAFQQKLKLHGKL
jgi:hypothetical protein